MSTISLLLSFYSTTQTYPRRWINHYLSLSGNIPSFFVYYVENTINFDRVHVNKRIKWILAVINSICLKIYITCIFWFKLLMVSYEFNIPVWYPLGLENLLFSIKCTKFFFLSQYMLDTTSSICRNICRHFQNMCWKRKQKCWPEFAFYANRRGNAIS